jgi:hypothetical protein
VKAAGEFADQPVFLAFHFAARGGAKVIVTPQMEQSMDQVTHNLGLPRDAEPGGLKERLVRTDENLAKDSGRIGLGVIKGDDVRGTGVAEAGFVEPRHFAGTHQVDCKIVLTDNERVVEQAAGDLAKEPEIDAPGALAIGEVEIASH